MIANNENVESSGVFVLVDKKQLKHLLEDHQMLIAATDKCNSHVCEAINNRCFRSYPDLEKACDYEKK